MPFGIELECASLDIKAPDKEPKGTVIVKDGRTFKAVFEPTSAKQPVVEFVSDPPASSLEQLKTTAARMATLARTWEDEAKHNSQRGKSPRIVVQGLKREWVLEQSGRIDGALQITIGVPLACVPHIYGLKCFENYGDARLHDKMSEHWKSLQGKVRAGTQEGPDGKALPALSPEAWGFIWILIDYLFRAGDEQKKPFIKAKFDTLARTDFCTMFSLLPQAEKDHLSERRGGVQIMRTEWRRWLMRQAMEAAEVSRFAQPAQPAQSKVQSHDILIALGKQMIPWQTAAGVTPTFDEWMKNIPHEDLFAAKKRPNLLMGLGALENKLDTVIIRDAKVPAPIFELRAPLGSSIHYTQWVDGMTPLWEKYQQVLAFWRPALAARPAVDAVRAAIQARQEREAQEAVKQRARAQAKEREARPALNLLPPKPPKPPKPPTASAVPASIAVPAALAASSESAKAASSAAPAKPPSTVKRSMHDEKNRDLP